MLYISVVSKIIRVVSRVYCIYDSSRALIGSYVDVSLITSDIWLAEIGMHSVFIKVTGHIEGSVHKGSISRNPNFSGNEFLCFASFTS